MVLAFAGDVHFEGALAELPRRRGSTLGELSGVLREADVAVVNLEAAIVDGDLAPASKELEEVGNRYWFSAPPSALGVLARSGVDVASVANNHGADYGAAGLRDTLAAEAGSRVDLVGAGRTPRGALRPYRTTVRGTDVAVLAADASFRESVDATWAVASGAGPGLAAARQDPPTKLVTAVRRAASANDIVAVYLHWGDEGAVCPTSSQQQLAGRLAEAGADIVVGSHAHVQQGNGMLGDTFVDYGLGNFAWYTDRPPATGVLRLAVRGGRVVNESWRAGIIPEGGGTPRAVTGPARAAAVSDLGALRGCTNLEPGPGDVADQRGRGLPDYTGTVRTLDRSTRRSMRGVSYRAGCPVGLDDLRLLTMTYVGFDREAHTGRMVVHRDVSRDVVELFGGLYDARFPIRRMQLVDAYDGDDDASMAANNTSAYNCRQVAGSSSLSDHAYGRAIDINPVQNPYVTSSGTVLPPAGRPFVLADRTAGARVAPGVIRNDDVVTGSFDRLGWAWGGLYSSPDFQHFTAG